MEIVQRILLLALLGSFVLTFIAISVWAPYIDKFGLLIILPLTILIVSSINVFQDYLQKNPIRVNDVSYRILYTLISVYLPVLGLLMLTYNLKYGIVHSHQSNEKFENSLQLWLGNSNTGDVIFADDFMSPILRFWGNRPNSINLHELLIDKSYSQNPLNNIRRIIDASLCEGTPVIYAITAIDTYPEEYIMFEGVTRDELKGVFNSYDKEEVFSYINSFTWETSPVYRLVGPSTCNRSN